MTEPAPLSSKEACERLTLVVHELRAPLTVIRGYLQLLDRDDSLTAEEREAAATAASHATKRLEQLLEDLVAAVSDPMVFSPAVNEPVSMLALVKEVVDEIEPLAERPLSVSGDPGVVEGDPTRLRQVLENLVSNAIKHTPDTGTVGVNVEDTRDGQVRVTVEDSGPGIAAEYREIVFDLFERVRTDSRATAGMGLGLPIARAIVRAHGGELTLDDTLEETGARFVATLPAGQGSLQ